MLKICFDVVQIPFVLFSQHNYREFDGFEKVNLRTTHCRMYIEGPIINWIFGYRYRGWCLKNFSW